MDKIPLNSFQILAIFFPGILLAFASGYCYYYYSIENLDVLKFFFYFKDYGVGFYFAFVCFGIFLGFVLDAIRNGLLESTFDKFQKINWDFFYKGEHETVVILYSRYYNYYVFDVNISVALILALVMQLFVFNSSESHWIEFIEGIIVLTLIRDAIVLRSDIYKTTNKK